MTHVFISYSQRDKRRREQVAEILEAENIKVWFDARGIALGEHLEERIFPALRVSSCAVFILTKNSVHSEWVRREIEFSQAHSIPMRMISFGDFAFPDSFPKEIQSINRVVVRQRFSKRQAKDFATDVARVFFSKVAPVLTILNLKGGVGKTTLAANLFGCLHEFNRKSVLLIDLDPQHNLTQLLLDKERMADSFGTSRNVMAMFRGAGTLQPEDINADNADRVLSRCRVELTPAKELDATLHLIPGTFEVITYFLGFRHQHFSKSEQPWMNFQRFIAHCRRKYDVVAIDVNPGATLMTEVALSVSTHILSPVRPDRFAKYGLTLLERLLEKIDGDFDRVQKLVIMNGVERSGPDAIETTMRKELSEFPFPNQRLMQSRIPVSKRLMARPAKPGVRDLTLELAYHSALGSSPIQKDLQSAALELATELGL